MNNELSPLGVLQLLNTTKAERQSFVEQVISVVTEGHVNAVEVHLYLKCMEEIAKAVKENKAYKAQLMADAAKYGKSYEFHNAKIDIRSAAGKYDYSADSEYNVLKAALKAREEYLKALPVEGIAHVTDEGEVVQEYPPVYKAGEETVFVTLK
jgi:hypothetical protein